MEDRALFSSNAVCWEYFPATDHWEELTRLTCTYDFNGGYAVNDRLVFLDTWDGILTLFDPAMDQCYELALLDWRNGMVIFTTGNSIIYGLGATNHLWEIKLSPPEH
jgi:hypothetical protein